MTNKRSQRGSEVVEAAHGYAERGWAVLPLLPGDKRPAGKLVPHGLKEATTDHDVIASWWKAEPAANVGLTTGVAFDVLDIDGPAAQARLDAAMPRAADPDDDELLEGPTVATPRGHHLYVQATGHGNTVNVGGLTGIDWRGRGGYVVAPPSRKADGTAWSWITGTPFDLGPDTPIRPASAWLLALLDRRSPAPSRPPAPSAPRDASAYARAALEREIGRVLLAEVGTRNHTLNRAAHALGQLVATGALDVNVAGNALVDAAVRAGLSEQEADATVRSGLRAGMTKPRAKR